MRLPLGQRRDQQRDGGVERREPVGIVEKTRGVRLDQLAVERAEMLGEPAAPIRGDLVAGLQQRAPARRLPAAHQPGVPPALACQQLDDQRAFAVAPGRKHEAGVTPFHQTSRREPPDPLAGNRPLRHRGRGRGEGARGR